jgi:hypothetical protein
LQSAPRAEAQQTLIRVAYNNGRWRVTESGARNAVANFGERRDAMEYATWLAASVHGSLVIHKRQLEACGGETADAAADDDQPDDDPPTARS